MMFIAKFLGAAIANGSALRFDRARLPRCSMWKSVSLSQKRGLVDCNLSARRNFETLSNQMLTDKLANTTSHPMIERLPRILFTAALLLASSLCDAAFAGDQARTVLNSIDPNKLNELLEISKTQPDAALTNFAPISANKFRFLFVWPASNPLMTYERVGRTFVERLVQFADQMQLLADGFCLPARNMYYGVTEYGDEEINVAYRDIEVHYLFGWQTPCAGKYISVSDFDESLNALRNTPGYGALTQKAPPQQTTPQEGLKPFLNPVPAAPLE
jgi:hypothetical protein